MAKTVFRPGEIALSGGAMVLDPPHTFPGLAHLAPPEEPLEDIEEVEQYTGPTADDLRREAEAFKSHFEENKIEMIRSANAETEEILARAREDAADETRRGEEEAQRIKDEAAAEAEKILAEAREKAARIEADSQAAFDAGRKAAEEEGRAAGREEGFTEGRAEVERLVERARTILERAQDKREEILIETEQQIIGLVLVIANKVIKIISENQRDVVIATVSEALRKVKGRGEITVRVNIADLELTTEHTKDFIALVEGAKSLQVMEDSNIEPGGCVIETDFGEIDARISSQFEELKSRILEISPIQTKPKGTPSQRADGGGGAFRAAAGDAISFSPDAPAGEEALKAASIPAAVTPGNGGEA